MSKLAFRLKTLRMQKGMTQSELAKAMDVSQNAIFNWETGKREPNAESIEKLAKILGITPAYLMGWDEPQKPITIAAHFEGDNFTPEELKQIEQFAEFIKSKRTPKEETFLNAAHDMGATPEQRRNADDIMQDDSEWDDIPAPKRATAPAKRHEEELLAAHARIDVESTPEGLQHDLDIMNDDSQWDD